MTDRFTEKAQAQVKDFRGFPSVTHPLWKGFPQGKWKSAIEKMKWHGSSFSMDVESDSFDVSANFPFLTSDFSVVRLVGGQLQWLGEKPSHIEISRFFGKEGRSEENLGAEDKEGFHRLCDEISSPGFSLHVSENYDSGRALVCIVDSTRIEGWCSFEHNIHLEKNAKLNLILISSQKTGESALASNLIYGNLADSSALNLVHVPGPGEGTEHSHARFEFSLGEKSSLDVVDLGMNVTLGRCETHINLNGAEAKAHISGIHLLGENQVYDSRVRMNHLTADTESRQNFKCVIADQSHSVFGGNIIIKKDAQRVNSSQSHKALLLSKGAKSSAFPELEIDADDVKAAHGSSTGQLDREQVFYLKSRGLNENEAIHLLSEAFIKDVVLKQENPQLRAVLENILSQALPRFIHKMESKWSGGDQ